MHPIDLMCQQADTFIANGYSQVGAPQGCNGPHADPETHLRNSAHWLILLSRLWLLTKRESYRAASHQISNVLMSDEKLRVGQLPIMRMKKGKDAANGVIGNAWLIEGLVIGGKILERNDLLAAAKSLSRYFSFDQKRKLWLIREPDGELKGIDSTLNHQIWYAMAISSIPDPDQTLFEEIEEFSRGLSHQLRFTNEGNLSHTIKIPLLSKLGAINFLSHYFSKDGLYPNHPALQNKVTRKLREINTLHSEKETGYLVFTLHALARLLKTPHSSHLDKQILMKAFARLSQPSFNAKFYENKWSFSYNPPGFEYPLVAELLGNKEDIRTTGRSWYNLQISKTYDRKTGTFNKNNYDTPTATARLYALSLCSTDTLNALSDGV